ncbi:MAG: ACT domain-containing protein [Bdellovibrionales bacterium]|nr:ACT domain-containing protein [Bdellovibrionales bacterium]
MVDIITQSHNEEGQRLAFSVSEEDSLPALELLKEWKESKINVEVMKNMAKISTIGVGMRNHPGVAARFFSVLDNEDIPVHLVTTSEIKISAVIDKQHLLKAAESLHQEFGLDA